MIENWKLRRSTQYLYRGRYEDRPLLDFVGVAALALLDLRGERWPKRIPQRKVDPVKVNVRFCRVARDGKIRSYFRQTIRKTYRPETKREFIGNSPRKVL